MSEADPPGEVPRHGLAMREARYPERAPIDAYGNGGFRFADMSHRGSILCVPSGIYAWAPSGPDDLTPEAFERVKAERAGIDALLVGVGPVPFPMPEALAWDLRAAGLRFDTMTTGAAVRTFNVMLSERRRVAAALIAVD